MCIFAGSRDKMTRVTGLLQGKDDFPIPVVDDFGGDVIVGWRAWSLYRQGETTSQVRSTSRHTVWTPGSVMTAGSGDDRVTPRIDSGLGVYCYGSKSAAKNQGHSIFGEVALWGEVLDFRGGNLEGAMGQFAYPLSFYAEPKTAKKLSDWAKTGVEIYDRSSGVRIL